MEWHTLRRFASVPQDSRQGPGVRIGRDRSMGHLSDVDRVPATSRL